MNILNERHLNGILFGDFNAAFGAKCDGRGWLCMCAYTVYDTPSGVTQSGIGCMYTHCVLFKSDK